MTNFRPMSHPEQGEGSDDHTGNSKNLRGQQVDEAYEADRALLLVLGDDEDAADPVLVHHRLQRMTCGRLALAAALLLGCVSSAACTSAIESASFVPPHSGLLSCQAPKPMALTFRPELPNGRYNMPVCGSSPGRAEANNHPEIEGPMRFRRNESGRTA